jgi:tRNA threonylcarbamoyl adenosine modification protein YeaZ
VTGSRGGDGLVLAFDTATRSSLVVVGRAEPLATSVRAVAHRHGSHLLEQIDEALASAGATLGDVAAIVVGTGPGSFTGLRVGLGTAKTVAYARGLALLGVPTSDALRRAARAAGAPADVAIVLPAGAHDHYLALAGEAPVLVATSGLASAIAAGAAMSVDGEPGLLGAAAGRLGAAAVAGLPAALLAIAVERLVAGEADEPADLVPAYVALPRGVPRATEELAWSPGLR